MTTKEEKAIIITLLVVIVLALCAGGYVGYKFYKHEKSQASEISELNSIVGKLSARVEILENDVEGKDIEWDENGYNYLAVGNSITIHDLATYWWDDDRGMASSSDDKDYVHLVENYLEESYGDVTTNVTNLASWETNGFDREEFLPLINPYLSDDVDLVTIQLGENASDLDTWESDFENLISYVHEGAPNAKILVIGDFWSNGDRDSLKEQAAEAEGAIYVSLDGIKDNEDYYAGLGTEVEDSDGELHTIEHSGVASHPGDKGMEAIADRIIEALQN